MLAYDSFIDCFSPFHGGPFPQPVRIEPLEMRTQSDFLAGNFAPNAKKVVYDYADILIKIWPSAGLIIKSPPALPGPTLNCPTSSVRTFASPIAI